MVVSKVMNMAGYSYAMASLAAVSLNLPPPFMTLAFVFRTTVPLPRSCEPRIPKDESEGTSGLCILQLCCGRGLSICQGSNGGDCIGQDAYLFLAMAKMKGRSACEEYQLTMTLLQEVLCLGPWRGGWPQHAYQLILLEQTSSGSTLHSFTVLYYAMAFDTFDPKSIHCCCLHSYGITSTTA